MKVFITGASGWVGRATTDELLAAGHEVTGLVRSEAAAQAVEAQGATALRGDLDDLESLRRGAAAADAVVHLANKHDWSDRAATDRAERQAVQTLGDALTASDRAFVVASGVAGLVHGRPVTEADANPNVGPEAMRGGSERLALDFADRGVRTVVARFAPTVHGTGGDHGFIALIAQAARRSGVSAYIGEGTNGWAAVHRADTARLIRIGIEQAPAGTVLHAAAEESVPIRAIAEALGAANGWPVTSIPPTAAEQHFGFIGRFFGLDMSASSADTRERFGWAPTRPTLSEDIAAGGYPGD